MEKKLFICEICNYKTNKHFNFKRHQNAKHEQKNDNKELLEIATINSETTTINSEIATINSEIATINSEIATINSETTTKKKKIPLFCERCNKKYMNKQYLDNHIKQCKGIDSLTCPKCMKHFNNSSGKCRHIKRNNCKAKSIIHATNNNDSNTCIINNNNCNNNNNNNTTINNTIINNFGSERTDFITFDDMIQILRYSGNFIIPKYIELKHFNKDFPENNNIKFEKNNECFIKRNNEWKYSDLDYLTNKLISTNSSEIFRYYNKEKIKIEDIIKDLDIIELIKKRLNYLDLSLDRIIFKEVKTEIKNLIKSSRG